MSRILIIEDDANYREDLALILEMEGFQVWQAAGAAEGFALGQAVQPDIILQDLLLPDEDGLDLARKFKQAPDTALVPIIVISGRGRESDESIKALEVADEYIRKPCRSEEVKARVRSMLRLKQVQDQYVELNQSLEARIREQTVDLRNANRFLQEEMIRRETTEKEVQALNARLLKIRDDEREHLSRKLHDDLGQQTMALKWKVQGLYRDGFSEAGFLDIFETVDHLTATTRRLAHDLSPAAHAHLGLVGALEELLNNLPNIRLVQADLEALKGYFPGDWDENVYYIVREAIQNVIKHAQATELSVHCWNGTDGISIAVRDNGRGIPDGPRAGGLGLKIMEQRARGLGGVLAVRSSAPGTLVEFSVQSRRVKVQ